MKKFVTVREAATAVDRHYTLIYEAIRKNKLKANIIGGVKKVDLYEAKRLYSGPKQSFSRSVVTGASVMMPQAAQASEPTVTLHPNAEPIARLAEAVSSKFGRYAPPLDRVLNAAVDLVLADMEGRVSVREAA